MGRDYGSLRLLQSLPKRMVKCQKPSTLITQQKFTELLLSYGTTSPPPRIEPPKSDRQLEGTGTDRFTCDNSQCDTSCTITCPIHHIWWTLDRLIYPGWPDNPPPTEPTGKENHILYKIDLCVRHGYILTSNCFVFDIGKGGYIIFFLELLEVVFIIISCRTKRRQKYLQRKLPKCFKK